jgi:hypothetical protein
MASLTAVPFRKSSKMCDRVRRSFSVRSKIKRNRSELFSLRSDTEGFISLVLLWSETVDFICKMKRKWSETKRKKPSEKKRKKQSQRNKVKISKKYFEANEGKKPLFTILLKRNKKHRSEKKIMKAKQNDKKNMEAKTKRTEKYVSETKRKEKYWIEKKYTEAKRCKKDIWEAKRSEKIDANFRLNMQNGSETNPVSLRFPSKRKKIEAKPAHPNVRGYGGSLRGRGAGARVYIIVIRRGALPRSISP